MAPPPKVNTQPEWTFWNQDLIENLNLYNQWESNPYYGKQAYNLSFSLVTKECALQLANV